jgi:hypothetical protein
MRTMATCLLFLNTLLIAGSASAYDPYDPKNCKGVGWDDKSPWVIAKVTAKPQRTFTYSAATRPGAFTCDVILRRTMSM